MMLQFLAQVSDSATLNITILKFFMPIFLFLFVFALMYALLKSTKLIGTEPFPLMIISFVIAIVFVVTPAAVNFTHVITPWIVVFVISLLFIFMILSWLGVYQAGGGGLAGAVGGQTWVAWVVLIVILAIFIFAGISAFGPLLSPFESGEDAGASQIIGQEAKKVLFHPAVLGLALLFIIAAVVAWVLGVKPT